MSFSSQLSKFYGKLNIDKLIINKNYVIQETNINTAVTLNSVSGYIDVFNSTINSLDSETFTVYNSYVTENSIIFAEVDSLSLMISIYNISNGSFQISLRTNFNANSSPKKVYFIILS